MRDRATSAKTPTYHLGCTINGAPVDVEVDPCETIYDTLRERLRLTGTKGACLEGECGSCTILVDGVPATACLMLAPQLEGREVTTIEGLAQGSSLHVIQESFVCAGAVQCGYCTPGLIMSTAALLAHTPTPTVEEIRSGLAGNLCRCTGYMKIVAAVQDAATNLGSAASSSTTVTGAADGGAS